MDPLGPLRITTLTIFLLCTWYKGINLNFKIYWIHIYWEREHLKYFIKYSFVFERDILSKLFLVNWKPDSQLDIVCFFNYKVFGCTLGQSPLVLLLSPGPQYWKKRHQLSFLVHPLKLKIKPFSNWEFFPGISKVIK